MYFSVFQDAKGEWRWRLYTGNNKIIADSSEGYANKTGALAMVKLIKLTAGAANIFDASTQTTIS